MPVLNQVSFSSGELSPALHARVDLARYATGLKKCLNFFVLATGGISNRPGTQFVSRLSADSLATLIPFVFSTEQSYMLVFQQDTASVFSNGAFVTGGTPVSITNVEFRGVSFTKKYADFDTSGPHDLVPGDQVDISGLVGTDNILDLNASWSVLSVGSPTLFTIQVNPAWDGIYSSGGQLESAGIEVPYQSDDLAALRYTQSADVVTLVHQTYPPAEFVRTSASTFEYGEIADFENGPFRDFNATAITMTASAATGTGITLTASGSIFTPEMIGSVVRLDLEDISAIKPWEASKKIAASGENPLGLIRRSLGKVYRCATNEVASGDGTYTGTLRPSHEEGIESDGDGKPITDLAQRAGVEWEYLHSLYGIARITAVAPNGLTATADVVSYIPVISPATTLTWALGAWSEAAGYPKVVTYFGDRLVFANTPIEPQTQWASKVGEYHDFGESAPLVDDDAITQTLNAKQVNAILELVPMDQLVSLTSSSSWASPQRGEPFTPSTIGFFGQSFNGAADLRAIQVNDYALFVQYHGRKVRELKYGLEADKYGGEELTILARHLFKEGVIVDWDYAEEPYGIAWMIRSDGALVGLTYLPEQQVIGWHRHNTDGFFERVCVIPEEGRDAVYFVVRREVNGETVRYLERLASREYTDQVDGYFVDCGLSYDGRNATDTTIAIYGASYDGGQSVLLTASADVFAETDIGDAILFDGVRIQINNYVSPLQVNGVLDTPVPASLQDAPSSAWTFARRTFRGLDHLEGKEVAICADGASLIRQTVTTGAITLPYAKGVVHIGLPYRGEAETLEATVLGSPQSIRDRPKNIPSVTVVVEDTVGLKVGPDADNLEDFAIRDTEYYTDPISQFSNAAEAWIVNSWKNSGRVVMVQDDPLPATILAVLPNVRLGAA